MKTTALIAILASMLLPSRHDTPSAESYEWVAGEVKPWEVGYSNCNERLESPRK
jgi:hypothetical protein